MRGLILGISMALASQATAQSAETLADIRQELSVLFVEVQTLQRELSTTGSPALTNLPASVLDRVAVMERELQRLTAQSEQLSFRIDRIVADGTNRIGDLEFRLCELEAGCDIGSLGETSTLGGGVQPPAPRVAPQVSGGAQLAVSERADFDRAQEALGQGDFRRAADLFAAFSETYPGGPLTPESSYLRGTALLQLGEDAQAARAFLNAFSSAPSGGRAADALLGLGQSLSVLGQVNEACVTLGEIGARFPGSTAVGRAELMRQSLGC